MVLPVEKIMRKKVATCDPESSVLEACKILKEFNTSTVVIVDKEKNVLGVFSERDLVNKVVTEKKNPEITKVSEVMNSPAITGDISKNDVDIAALIVEQHITKIPIVNNGKLVGIVAEYDLLKNLANSIINNR